MFMLRLCCRYSNLSESFFIGQEVSDDVISNEPGIAADRMAMIHYMVTKGYTVKLAKVTHDLVPENATELAIQAGDVVLVAWEPTGKTAEDGWIKATKAYGDESMTDAFLQWVDSYVYSNFKVERHFSNI